MSYSLLKREIKQFLSMFLVNCPAGTKYVKDSQTCVVCPVGTYQELDGQSDCKKCQKGYSTHGYRASNYTACKGKQEFCQQYIRYQCLE